MRGRWNKLTPHWIEHHMTLTEAPLAQKRTSRLLKNVCSSCICISCCIFFAYSTWLNVIKHHSWIIQIYRWVETLVCSLLVTNSLTKQLVVLLLKSLLTLDLAHGFSHCLFLNFCHLLPLYSLNFHLKFVSFAFLFLLCLFFSSSKDFFFFFFEFNYLFL